MSYNDKRHLQLTVFIDADVYQRVHLQGHSKCSMCRPTNTVPASFTQCTACMPPASMHATTISTPVMESKPVHN
jgi:hypothetical protein